MAKPRTPRAGVDAAVILQISTSLEQNIRENGALRRQFNMRNDRLGVFIVECVVLGNVGCLGYAPVPRDHLIFSHDFLDDRQSPIPCDMMSLITI